MKKSVDLIPQWLKWSISGFCVLLLLIHMFSSTVNLDWVAVALLGFMLVPWFIHLIKEVELPGGGKVAFGSVQQDVSETSAPTSQEPRKPSGDLLSDRLVIKTLKTLWKYQQEYFSDDPVKRWTFKVTPPTPGYGGYLASVATLYKAGFVTVSPENAFCMLTNEGINFCKENTERIMGSTDIYLF